MSLLILDLRRLCRFDFTPKLHSRGVYLLQDVDVDGWDTQKSWKAQMIVSRSPEVHSLDEYAQVTMHSSATNLAPA
jgi:hypothetical protein